VYVGQKLLDWESYSIDMKALTGYLLSRTQVSMMHLLIFNVRNIQPLNGVEGGGAFTFTPNRFASLAVIHIQPFGFSILD